MTDIDETSPEYMAGVAAGRIGLAEELMAEAKAKKQLTREDVERMTPDEINANWPEVQRVMAAAK